MKKFEAGLDSPRHVSVVEADTAEAEAMGATGTPAFFVNGRYLFGAKPYEDFAKVLNEELTKRNLPVPAGAPSGS